MEQRFNLKKENQYKMNMLLTVLLSEGPSAFSLITPNPGLAIWTFIIFVGLLFILGKFAFKPIANSLKEREKSIEESLMQAEKARAEMAALTSKNQELLDQAKEERTKILAEARDLGEKLKNDMVDKAKQEAERKIQDAVREIDTQKNAAIVEVKNVVGAIALEVAGKILRKELSNDADQKAFVEKLIKETNLN
jgi:F-type H+-transporting ATPase subunit b